MQFSGPRPAATHRMPPPAAPNSCYRSGRRRLVSHGGLQAVQPGLWVFRMVRMLRAKASCRWQAAHSMEFILPEPPLFPRLFTRPCAAAWAGS